MDVRCPRCQVEYELDDVEVPEAGLTVKCDSCAHVFRANRGSPPPISAPDLPPAAPSREWKVRRGNGSVSSFADLTALQRWIVERKVSRDDEISLTGQSWKRLGTIPELESFFLLVDEAQAAQMLAAQALESPQAPRLVDPPLPRVPTPSTPPARVLGPIAVTRQQKGFAISANDDVRLPSSGLGRWIALGALALFLGGAGFYFFVVVPDDEARAAAAKAAVAKEEERVKLEAEAAQSSRIREEELARAAAVRAGSSGEVDAGEGAKDESPPDAAAPAPVDAANDFTYFMAEGDRLRERENFEAAMRMYQKAQSLKPESIEPITGKGLVQVDMSLLSQAEATFQEALKINARYGPAIMGLAETYRLSGKAEQALDMYRKYLEVLPTGTEAQVARQNIEKLSGNSR